MAHKHSVYDTDSHFSINPITRKITNESSTKTTLIQYDHDSERFTFEIPREVEGHDMSLCNRVEIHYLNIDSSTKATNAGVYEVQDLQVSPESDDVVILSWLISQNATQLVGSLNFLVRFAGVEDDGTVNYAWNTAIFTNISVSSGIFNSEVIVEQYADVLEQWKAELEAAASGGSGGTFSGNASDVTYDNTESGMEATTVQKAIDELKNSQDSQQNVDLTGYAKETWVQEGFQPKGEYLTEVPDGYAKTEDIPEAYTLPVGGENLGGVKNGGNVVINADGTMTAPETGGSSVVVDAEMSSTSENPVQNKVVKAYVDAAISGSWLEVY